MMKRLTINTRPNQKVFFSSDWHLGHRNVLQYDSRPFNNIDDHDRLIIDNWNYRLINTGNIGFLLGDFALTNERKLDEYAAQIAGTVYYVQGNHDHKKDLKILGRYFEILAPLQEVEINGQLIVLCHYCMMVWNKSHRGSWHLFGHSHGNLGDLDGKRIDVGINNWNYTPVELDLITKVMGSKKIHEVDHHVAD